VTQRHNRQIIVSRTQDLRTPTRTVKESGPKFETEYVKNLKAQQRIMEADEVKARQGNVKKDNHICKLVLDTLGTNGARTRGRLARDLNLSLKVIKNVGEYLLRRKLIEEYKGQKGDMIYRKAI